MNYTLLIVAIGSAVLGTASGMIGTFAVLRKQSLLSDAVSHSALLGVALMFLLFGKKDTAAIFLGALASGVVAVYLINKIVRSSKTDYGTALALIMTALFGGGLIVLTIIQKTGAANQGGLESVIFGQASAMLISDVITLLIVSAVLIAVIMIFWKEFKLYSFDPAGCAALGFSPKILGALMTVLFVGAVAVGVQTVGVILMSAMLIEPAVAARQWSNRLGIVVILAALFGAASGLLGALLSSAVENMPSGPATVLAMSAIVFISLIFSPKRGILWHTIRRIRLKKEFKGDSAVR